MSNTGRTLDLFLDRVHEDLVKFQGATKGTLYDDTVVEARAFLLQVVESRLALRRVLEAIIAEKRLPWFGENELLSSVGGVRIAGLSDLVEDMLEHVDLEAALTADREQQKALVYLTVWVESMSDYMSASDDARWGELRDRFSIVVGMPVWVGGAKDALNGVRDGYALLLAKLMEKYNHASRSYRTAIRAQATSDFSDDAEREDLSFDLVRHAHRAVHAVAVL